ncbi:hypothetical protein PsYK624_019870 [Phanerochaete sordida]|uniref:Uncharacterized protein n=1 Tax=Phanerochaete sordida TaxID=48140 RepID=A0A9P3FZ45_9APHY|nr:hypothetical protein PsYK624_019870 [Phanerochaete sordida]
MRPTSFLTRLLAVSVLFVGAVQVAHAAPAARRGHAVLAGPVAARLAAAGVVPRHLALPSGVDVEESTSSSPADSSEDGNVKRTCFFIWGCK